MDLSGTWKAEVADEELRRAYPSPEFSDDGWTDVPVPSHWRSHAPFDHAQGPLLLRRQFEAPVPADGRRGWLTFDGVFYQSDVWLDGAYVGDTEGYFFPHTFEVTDALRDRSEHVLGVEVTCSPQKDRTAKRNITGVFQHWDCLDPDWNPGGIWRPVRLSETGPVRIARLRVLCSDATPERAVVTVRAVLDVLDATTVELRTTIGGHTDHTLSKAVAAGENRIEWTVAVDRPRLWWPHALGDQPLADVAVTVLVPHADEPSDTRTVRTGLRQVRMKRWIVAVNGERLFLKGTNQGPTRMALGEASAAELERDVVLAKDAGLDLLRLHAHVSRPEVYEAADRHGMLLWQDFPLQWGYARGTRKQAVRQVREAVDLLGHHPSIAIWCGHNEPLALDVQPGAGVDELPALGRKFMAAQQLPTFNKTILDSSVKRAFEKSDRTRPVVAHSGVLPHVGSGGTDTHVYFGWYHGDERDFPGFCRAVPRLARFVTEFGAQAVPASDDFLEPEAWPDLDWKRLARTHALQKHVFERVGLAPEGFATFDEWREATQRYQAEVVRFHVETLRRLKYRPTGGFAQFAFADAHPSVTWSVLDHERRPKAAYDALRAACAPVLVVADRPAATYTPGDAIALDVHVVSDLRTPLDDLEVTALLRWTGGEHRWHWGGAVPADACVRVGTVTAVAPDAPGPLELDLSLTGGGHGGTTAYASAIERA